MANKTLYIRDNDELIWQKAEEVVVKNKIESLSKFVTDAIKKEVNRMVFLATVKEDIQKIVVTLNTEEGIRKVAFNGKWLIENYSLDFWLISVAITEKNSIFLLYDTGSDSVDKYRIFEYFEDFINEDLPSPELKSLVANKVGEDYIEFLDI